MGLSVLHTNPDGDRIMIRSDILGISERIQKGDPTCAWSGDPYMYVVYNQRNGKYEVWRLCEDNRDRIISSWVPAEFDARVIKNLAENDSQVHDVLGRIEKHNDALEASRAREIEDLEAEMKKEMKWMARKLYEPGTDPAPYTGGSK